nr:hypothetical protein [Microbacterium bovistercoris]
MTLDKPPARLPQLVFLGLVAGIALALSVILVIVGAAVAGSSYGSPDALVAQAALGAWSNLFLWIGLVAGVGAVVLTGVRALLYGPTASDQAAAERDRLRREGSAD